ncbi:MAG: hypothetical protein COA78_17480 [Blastopirellula sp.]|nr:MAG: hypothetical protein COA78_17480 [Blastopirellula sp.]
MVYVLFSIDDVADTHTLAKFLRHMDGLSARGMLDTPLQLLHGMWKGRLEQSFILTKRDFYYRVAPNWVVGQEAVFQVSGEWHMSVTQVDSDGKKEVGRMYQTTAKEALNSDGFTYCPIRDIYWVLK